jgi:hypothetical protein
VQDYDVNAMATRHEIANARSNAGLAELLSYSRAVRRLLFTAALP